MNLMKNPESSKSTKNIKMCDIELGLAEIQLAKKFDEEMWADKMQEANNEIHNLREALVKKNAEIRILTHKLIKPQLNIQPLSASVQLRNCPSSLDSEIKGRIEIVKTALTSSQGMLNLLENKSMIKSHHISA